MRIIDNVKKTVEKAVVKVLDTWDAVNDHLDENPSSIYYGVLGMAFAVGWMLADNSDKIDSLSDKIDILIKQE